MKITTDLLKKLGACQTGIGFMVRNNLEGYDWDMLDKIEGDYKNFIGWLKYYKGIKLENNKLTYSNKYGNSGEHTYDDNGNLLTYKDSEGYWEKYTYDKNGNRLTYKDSEGFSKEYTYDDNGNQLTYKRNY
jgi:YD repeat-containing protein